MRAAVLTELNQPLQVWDQIQAPTLARGQVLVRLAYSGVCHSQLMEARGARGTDPYLPHLLGHEGTGIVAEVGPDVTKVKAGDRVILTWIKGSGIDAGGVKYSYENRQVNAGGVTTFNEMAVVSENRLVPLPDGVPMDIGVLFGCALLTGAGIVLNELKPHPGAAIAVFGLGGIGLSALIAAKLFSPRALIAVDISNDKLTLAKEFGATHTINPSQTNPVDRIRELTDGKGVDYSVEAGGLVKTIEAAFLSVRKGGGQCVFASHPAAGEKIALDPYDLISGRKIAGTWGGASDPDRDIPLIANLFKTGKLPLGKLISKRYQLSQINEALDDLEAGRATRPLIEIDPKIA